VRGDGVVEGRVERALQDRVLHQRRQLKHRGKMTS
jgi:hypothetical protein